MNANKELKLKYRQIRLAEEEKQEIINSDKWHEMKNMLEEIHKEIQPKLDLLRQAYDFVYRAQDTKFYLD